MLEQRAYDTQCVVTAQLQQEHYVIIYVSTNMFANNTCPNSSSMVPNVCSEVSQNNPGFVSFNPSQGIASFYHEFRVHGYLSVGRIPVSSPNTDLTTGNSSWTRFLQEGSIYHHKMPGALTTRTVEPVLKFQAPDPTSRSFWLRLRNNLDQKIRKNVLFV